MTFQDYNREVLKYWTIPNVVLNLGTQSLSNTRFTDGDWSDNIIKNLFRKIENPEENNETRYNLITGCDIIYEVKNYDALLDMFKNRLKPGGIVIISSKAFYYGNGGSIAEFKQFVKKQGLFEYKRLQKIQNGMGNRREIFSLEFL